MNEVTLHRLDYAVDVFIGVRLSLIDGCCAIQCYGDYVTMFCKRHDKKKVSALGKPFFNYGYGLRRD